MGFVTSALQIGRNAILANQGALQIVGNNVANAANPDYTRQTAGLTALEGTSLPGGLQPGAGVALTQLKRNLDEALEGRLRDALGNRESLTTQQSNLARLESLFNDVGGQGVGAQITDFFNKFSDVQNQPSDRGIRAVAIASGTGLAASLTRLRNDLIALGNDADSQIGVLVKQADQTAGQIADLNARILAAEAGGQGPASALRDQRDALLRDLSQLADVTVRTQSDGTINVYLGNEPLVLGGTSRGLTTKTTSDGQFTRTSILFADTGSQVVPRSGRLAGLMATRDQQAFARIEAVDRLARAIINDVNRIHADGQGLIGFSSLTGTYAVDDPTASLSSAGLPFAPTSGSFFIAVTNQATGLTRAYQINVDLDGTAPDTTLASLASDINTNVTGITATVTAGNRLSLTAADGLTFSFGNDGVTARSDTSGVLAALGLNTCFDGSSAADIRVNPALQQDPARLAAARVNFAGDGTNAGRLAGLANAASTLLSGSSISEGYQAITNDVAVTSGAAREAADASDTALSALQAQKESISGVSLDEEAINLLKYERAFQGAARYVTTVDRTLNELMSLLS
ncbi:MAG TPA: flagellar hook-associated protein FlgK [Phycisphaerae bacterium]